MKKIVRKILKLFLLIIFALALGYGSYLGIKKFFSVQTEKLYTTVSRTLEACQELTLYKMNYTDVITIKKRAAGGLAKSYSIIKYTGILRAGIRNAEEIHFTISDDRKSISVIIPPSELLGNDIQSQRVFDESQNLFLPIHTQEIFDEIENAKEDAAREILAEGLLDDADARALLFVKQLMTALGFEKISVSIE